jgi:hypothetical protein
MKKQVLTKVDKYSLSSVSFAKDEVLSSLDAIQSRAERLKRGLALGNLHKQGTKLRFENAAGELMETEGSIWAVTEQDVIFKKHIGVPIKSIFEVLL